MEKKTMFDEPVVRIIEINDADIIATSPGSDGNNTSEGDGEDNGWN